MGEAAAGIRDYVLICTMLARLFPKSFVMQLQLRVFSCEKKFVAFVACI